MSRPIQRDFSIRKEIETRLEENELNISVDDILNEVECDDLMIDIISLSIYEAIYEKLKGMNIEDDIINNKIAETKSFIVRTLTCRRLI